jgi:hypothetical protein
VGSQGYGKRSVFPSFCLNEIPIASEDFPPVIFVDHLGDLVLRRIQARVGNSTNALYPIPKTYISSVFPQLRLAIQPEMAKMQKAQAFRRRQTPKRKTSFGDSESGRYVTSFNLCVPALRIFYPWKILQWLEKTKVMVIE